MLHLNCRLKKTTMTALKGIHHVTAIGADAQRNVDFYSGVLGLRLVKKTVNFDDPNSYHLLWGPGWDSWNSADILYLAGSS